METRSLIRIIILLLLCLLIHVYTSQGQTFFNRGATVTVTPDNVITIRGSVENQGSITNRGHLKVSGPWINTGSYHAGEGRVTFNGMANSIPQIIHHNGQAFNRVTLAGGTKKVILSDMVITGELNFEHGIMEAAGDAKIVFDAQASITGASDSSHINGPVMHWGSGRKLFPVGNGLVYLPAELADVDDASARISLRVFESGSQFLSGAPTLQTISDKRYWHVEVMQGRLQNARIVLPLRGESWVTDPEEVVVAEASAPGHDFSSIGGTFLEEDGATGRVVSDKGITKPFIALATTASDPELIVYNAVSPNDDGLNDFFRIENIEYFPKNKLSIFNRWGDKVFEVDDYDNAGRSFAGRSNTPDDGELVTGTYFYVLELPQREPLRGFISLKK